jgi:sodium/potassium/calcium exchanger 6
MPSFSLLGALEFRSVISSLQQEATGSTLDAFEPLLTPYPGGHYHNFGRSRSRSHGSFRSGSPQLSDSSSDVPLNDRSPLPPPPLLPADDLGHSLQEAPLISTDSDAGPQIPQIQIVHTPASPHSETNGELANHTQPTRRQQIRCALSHASHILFPTLHEFHAKSLVGKVAAVFATPAVFLLTVTLPVVVRSYDSTVRHEKTPSIVHTLSTEDGIEHTLIAEEEVPEDLQFNKWLIAVQCVFGPVFCAAVLFSTLVYRIIFYMKESDILCRGFRTRAMDPLRD